MRRLAAFVELRRRRMLIAAGLFFVVAAAVGGPVAGQLKSHPTDFQDPASQNRAATRLLERATGTSAALGVVALVHTGADVRADGAAQAKLRRVAALIAAEPGFQRAVSYLTTPGRQLVSRDGREAIVAASFATSSAEDHAVADLRQRLGAQGVSFGGTNVAFHEIGSRVRSDLARAELLAFPLLFMLSLWIFRGLIAAALPPLVGAMAIITTFLLLRAVNEFVSLSSFALNLVTGLGLGLAIDYSLFILSRYREELAHFGPGREALTRTLATAGRTVLFSSLTVAAALASLLVFPQRFLYSMAIGGTICALVAGVVALIVLPAVLAALGERVNALAPARLQRAAQRAALAPQSGAWYRLAHGVMRRPGAVALASAAVLIVAGLPFLRVTFTPADYRVLPTTSQARQVSETIQRDFSSDASQRIQIAIRAPAADAAAVRTYASGVRAVTGTAAVAQPRYLGSGTWELDALPRGYALSSANQSLVRRVRALPAPFVVAVGGPTAAFIDQQSSIGAHLPVALAILAVTTFVVLFLMTGSVVLPLKALVINLLTLSAAFGLLVLVFQDGRLEGPLGFKSAGGLDTTQPVLLFALAFGLATDYGVFLLSRIKEAHDSGMEDREAVAFGVERTGRIITSAALLFCVAIGAFATSGVLFIKEVGVGTALAVALDATIARALLVPALMALLGPWNWWAPAPLRRLHARIGLREPSLEPAHGAA